MALKKSKCPNCGEISEVDDSEFNVVCRYCGVPYMPREGIDNYNKHINDVVESINIDTVNINNESVNNYALLGIAALKDGNHEKCGFYADDILKRKEDSPEGLLLKAFFVSNNYSKEEGIDNYLSSLKYAKDQELINLIISTLKKDILSFSNNNYLYLFEQLLKRKDNFYKDLFSYCLMCYFIDFDEKTYTIDELKQYFNEEEKLISSLDNKEIYLLFNNLFLFENNKLVSSCYLKEIRKEIDKYLTKKDKTNTSYYFYLNDEKIVSFNFSVENEKLDQYLKDNNFDINTIKGGCYIASCVYGSYNTKEVWILRRYRDYKLSKNILGRLFIKIYYLISPLMLRMFSNQKWFISLNKKILDKFVNKLNKEGYESTPYKD